MSKVLYSSLEEEVLSLKRERNAIILAHNYQIGEIQDIADLCADSLRLAQYAAKTDADVILFSGVHFMAETASILCPDKLVLVPDLEAGCSLAGMVDTDQLKKWKDEHPEGVVVAYVNTSAAVKALSDYCCTSTLQKDNPHKTFYPAARNAVCEYMKRNTLEKIVDSLENLQYEVKVPKELANRARLPIERMLKIV
ncbi:MAG: quinolinate synthase NadA [Chlamydiae bacterium]|nr:quinolinate synthase NadA [Chlamydiota bacterium]